ncbi:MAG: hypothetical protein ABIM99_02445 [Candidatus Dojkabacteria bacterium]
MNSSENKLHMAIVGAGGSGTSVQRELLINQKIDFDILLGVDDAFGSTGVVTKVLQRLDLSVFKSSNQFEDRRRILPIGDTRNNILRILNYTHPKGREIADILNQRVEIHEQIKTQIIKDFYKVFELLKINIKDLGEDFFKELDLFLTEYFNVYKKQESKILNEIRSESNFNIEKLKDLSFGNIFLMFFFLTSDSHKIFFSRLKVLGLIPENINFHYISEFRHVLLAKNDDGEAIIGEHNVDSSTRPLSPSEFYLCPVDRDGKPHTIRNQSGELEYDVIQPEIVQKKFEKILKNADTIFLATGSYANLFTQVKLLSKVLSKTNGLIIYVSNFARTQNEVHAQFAVDKLYRMINKQFVTLLVNYNLSSELLSDSNVRVSYRRQGKSFNEADEVFDFLKNNIKDPIFLERVLPILNLIHGNESALDLSAEDFVDKGIKHEPKEIARITIRLSDIYNQLASNKNKEEDFNKKILKIDFTKIK